MGDKPGLYKPLKQKVKYDIREHLITGKQVWWKKIIEILITLLCWSLLLFFTGYLVYGYYCINHHLPLKEFAVFNGDMLEELRLYFDITGVAILAAIAVLLIWKEYNLKRFGSRNRRKFRPDVSNDELAEFFETDESTLENMQNSRYIELDENIIPSHLGIGYSSKQK